MDSYMSRRCLRRELLPPAAASRTVFCCPSASLSSDDGAGRLSLVPRQSAASQAVICFPPLVTLIACRQGGDEEEPGWCRAGAV